MMNYTKYRPYPTMDMPNRKWPGNTITKAPVWCSVDMRDGNQSLEIPMNLPEKLKFFQFLVDTGFKEIEIGFPAASNTEFEFARCLIDNNLIQSAADIYTLTPGPLAALPRMGQQSAANLMAAIEKTKTAGPARLLF